MLKFSLLFCVTIQTATGIGIDELERAVEAVPDFAGTVVQLDSDEVTRFGSHLLLEGAKGLMKTADFARALPLLSKVAELETKHGAVHSSIGIALASLGQREGALKSLRKAVQLSPKDANSRARLALICEEEQLLQEACDEYEEAVRLTPKTAEHLVALAHVQRKLGLAVDSGSNFNNTLRQVNWAFVSQCCTRF